MVPEIVFILGTRPEIIKLSPVIRECERRDIPYQLVHSGQHYSDELDLVFFEQLELSSPDFNLDVGSDSHGVQTGEMLIGIEEVLVDLEPDVVLVQGDTNTVLAGAIAASKLDVELGHVEAGLRSFDRNMPEEMNRVLADHVADYLFAPTPQAAQLLRNEGLPEDRIYVTGNTVVDAVHQNRRLSREKSQILETLELSAGEFGLLTAHRQGNVDLEAVFSDILEGVASVARAEGIDIVYPIHPRAEKKLKRLDLSVPDIVRLITPQDYLDFLELERNAAIILTDSGGVQEEACILQIPCVTLRENTERPETVDVGANVVVGTEPEDILAGSREMMERTTDWENPFGDGTAARRILTTIGKLSRKGVSH